MKRLAYLILFLLLLPGIGWGATYNVTDYNIYYPVESTSFRISDVEYSFDDWKTETSQDSHSLISNPLVVSTSDFGLKAGSPAINAGINICTGVDTPVIGCTGAGTGTYNDFRGRPVDSLPDIGAYEGRYLILRIGAKSYPYWDP